MPKQAYYAVRVGRVPGIYDNWRECEIQVKGFSGAVSKKFITLEKAEKFINKSSTHQQSKVYPLTNGLQYQSECSSSEVSEPEIIYLYESDKFTEGLTHQPLISLADDSQHNSKESISDTSDPEILTRSNIGILKRPKPRYYAVKVGKIPGIYSKWSECEIQVKRFPGAIYKKCSSLEQARIFINETPTHQHRVHSFTNCLRPKKAGSNSSDLEHEIINLGESDKFREGSTDQQLQVQPLIASKYNRKRLCSKSLEPEIIDLCESDFLSDSGFDERFMPSTSRFLRPIPKVTYSSSLRNGFYAVHRGRQTGVFRSWAECSAQIKNFRNASYRKFANEDEAVEYVKTGGIQKASKSELRHLKISNEVVIKKRRLNDNTTLCGYMLKNSEEPVIIFTDGACCKNGRKGSRAGIGIYWGDNHPLNTSKRITGRQTNNCAEIYAAVHALNQAKQIGAKRVKLYTDSQFVIHAITDWIKKWKSNGWKLVTGKEVVNKKDFIALDNARQGLEVEWIYVKAHARNKGNDEADRLAVAGSKLSLEPKNCSEFQTL